MNNSEKQFKEDIENQRNMLEENTKTIQELSDKNLALKKENENMKRELQKCISWYGYSIRQRWRSSNS